MNEPFMLSYIHRMDERAVHVLGYLLCGKNVYEDVLKWIDERDHRYFHVYSNHKYYLRIRSKRIDIFIYLINDTQYLVYTSRDGMILKRYILSYANVCKKIKNLHIREIYYKDRQVT